MTVSAMGSGKRGQRHAFRRKLYHSLDELQADVDVWMQSYNAERTHSGKYCYGKTPLQTFIESATLAYDKQLDRMQPTSTAPTEVAASGGLSVRSNSD